MRLGGRIAAAIDILDIIERQKRPVTDVLKDWGHSHRFAGSTDRAAIGNLVFDSLRWKMSSAYAMLSDTPRSIVLATVVRHWNISNHSLAETFDGDHFAPSPLSQEEQERLSLSDPLDGAPAHVVADIPEWIYSLFEDNFGDKALVEGRALASRAPLDLRVNSLKANRDKVLRSMSRINPEKMPFAPLGLRFAVKSGAARMPNVRIEAAYQRGLFEIQDEGSQIAALLLGAKPGEQILDYCAGAGGKTLALAAALDNKGQLHAFDTDQHRLAPIYERITRSGARNVQVHVPHSKRLQDLIGKMDRVLVDAPCTGTGVWRRHPDAKWKVTAKALTARRDEQDVVLDNAQAFVRPAGFLCYVTCSLLRQENEHCIEAFLERHPKFKLVNLDGDLKKTFDGRELQPRQSTQGSITLTPFSTGTDGFFIALMERQAG